MTITADKTYTSELDTAVTALGCSALLLEVKVTELTTGSLDHTGDVGLGVVSEDSPVSGIALSLGASGVAGRLRQKWA